LTPRSAYPISAAKAKPHRNSAILSESSSPRASPGTAIALAPARDVEIIEGRAIATSEEPWLRLEDPGAFRPGGFVEIVYRTSVFDDPVRPILRFRLDDGAEIDRFLPGPVAGAAIWVGRVPRGTTDVWISPTRHRGRFDFLVERARRRNGMALWLQALQRSPRYALSAAFYGVPGFTAEYDMNLDWALGFTRFEQFDAWRKARGRSIDLTGIDAPRSDWTKGPRIHVCIAGRDGKESCLASLDRQIYTNWQLHESTELPADANEADLIFVFRAGDRLEPQAFACAVEHAARHPAQEIFYGDEMEWNEARALVPALKPDWSPLLQAALPYLGRAVFARVGLLRRRGMVAVPADLASVIGPPEAFPPERIGHLRRMLLTRAAEVEPAPPARAADARWTSSEPTPPAASIVIPTKDRGELLETCVASIFAKTSHPAYDIVIVDNGSQAPPTRAVLSRLGKDPRVTVLSRPGPFDFAGLCNAGATLGSSPILVFLNDDTSVRSADWLSRLGLMAARAETGAVGAKLLYADGRVQHSGVTVGIGETAGHFGSGLEEAEAGWCARNHVVHEVSAVTGACLAVERRKFAAVGGFDSANLPIELNDVDLCLRLSEGGWKTICLSAATLFHEESASRGGAKFRLLKVHRKERGYFIQRWRRIVRDDPFFHPAFSLFRRQEALG
jgi:GT2 family glycosyltransferase